MTRTFCLTLLLATALSGCVIVDSALFENLPPAGTDMGVDSSVDLGPRDLGPPDLALDGGPPGIVAADVCGDPMTPVLAGTTRMLKVDTTTATGASLTPSCGSSMARGLDRFFAIDVAAGEYWHFHLAADPMFEPSEMTRNPVVYVLASDGAGGCNERPATCGPVYADSCMGRFDEHFAFVAPAPGRYYVGVDDASAGGGHYELNAFRPVCGNGMQEHGESCDDRDAGTCTLSCRKIVGETAAGPFPAEAEFNDNPVEANEMSFFGTTNVQISGDVGGGLDCYPDVFQIRAMAANTHITVDALTMTGAACASASSALYSLELRDAAGTVRGVATDDPMGCPHIEAPMLAAGVYFLTIRADDLIATANAFYNLRITRTP